MKTERGLAPVFIVLILAALVGGYLIYQNQPKTYSTTSTNHSTIPTSVASTAATGSAETANWKTYINTKYGYSIKYPTGWIVDDQCMAKNPPMGCSQSQVYINSLEKKKFNVGGQDININYSISIIKTDRDPRDTTGLMAYYNPPGGYKEDKINNIDVLESLGMNNTLEFFFKKGENNYIFLSFGPYSKDSKKTPFPEQERFYKTFNQILSTFRFLP